MSTHSEPPRDLLISRQISLEGTPGFSLRVISCSIMWQSLSQSGAGTPLAELWTYPLLLEVHEEELQSRVGLLLTHVDLWSNWRARRVRLPRTRLARLPCQHQQAVKLVVRHKSAWKDTA
jgi:hypothetical protein